MTYGEDSDEPDFEDEENFLTAEAGNTDSTGDALAIDDSSLQPAKRGTP